MPFNRTIFGIETKLILNTDGKLKLLLIAPFLELKRICSYACRVAQETFNRTIFGIETQEYNDGLYFYISFNRTIFGIETQFQRTKFSMMQLLIAPFLELKLFERIEFTI